MVAPKWHASEISRFHVSKINLYRKERKANRNLNSETFLVCFRHVVAIPSWDLDRYFSWFQNLRLATEA